MTVASISDPLPSSSASTSASAATAIGSVKLRRRLAAVARRQAISGPMPDSSTSRNVSGTENVSNAGAAKLRWRPVSASEMSGKNVPHQITRHRSTSTRLLSRKTTSRESSESNRCSDRSSAARDATSAIEPAIIVTMSSRKGMPRVEAPNAWIDSRIPDRTRNVPWIARMPVASTSETFHVFSIPRFSWIITECRNAVPVSHGISDAFSTGSQAQ